MINTLLGTKKEMTSTYDYKGRRVGATIITLTPNYITQIKTKEGKDGYTAVQIGSMTKKSVRKPQLGHFKKAGVEKPLRFVKEVKAETVEDLTAGQEVTVADVFHAGDLVKVTGVSKGKGFQGGVRRYNFRGGPKTHGQSDRHRAPGSIGSGTTPGRVYKGKKMAGHMGMDQVSLLNLEVIGVDKQNNLLTLKGSVPGPMGALVVIEKQGQLKGYVAPVEPEEVASNAIEEEVVEETSDVSEDGIEETAPEVSNNETGDEQTSSEVISNEEKGEENA